MSSHNSNLNTCHWAKHLLVLVLLQLFAVTYGAEPESEHKRANQLSLLALFADKAMLHIGGEKRVLAVGETSPEGVTLIAVDSEHVMIERDGQRLILRMGIASVFPGTPDTPPGDSAVASESVTLWADGSGFFHASGYINGSPVEFLVDTGASSVAISSELARSIGVRFEHGADGIASTAAGMTRMKRVYLESVSVGAITLRNVEAGVLLGSFPTVPLLGMSFLGKLDMLREGNRMELKRR